MLPKRILILGLGQTGISVLHYCLAHHITPIVMDTRDCPPGAEQLPAHVERHFGALSLAPLLAAELIVASPGVPLATPELQQALEAGVEIIGDIELVVRALATRHVPIIAITGSNGKSTVTTLVAEMAAQAGIKVGMGGNIGTPALELLADQPQLVVLELSSFQLETTPSLATLGATVLNISEDHLDRYRDLAHYRDTKLTIYQDTQLGVFNREDTQTQPPKKVASVSFGLDETHYGRTEQDGQLWLSRAGQPLFPVSELKILGSHNQLNALAAMALSDQAGISWPAQEAVLRRFSGLKHRCQFVAEKKGVRWVNDSKATNVGATLAAIDGLAESAKQGRLWLIVGGQGKGQDFSPLMAVLKSKVAAMVCFGQDQAQLLALAANTHAVTNLAQAVTWCAEQATAGDTVLFAPACASLDMYGNYQLRGEHFITLVEAL
ncbi:UDP-N-acetylmuramoyl-L-alanine--D-glutamate ligase [Oceanisphaera avium]|uniref:UDP-N-acetylmuramoylalanine--D-glutamate ligase n=1 Tax=Oceanisphaera avium TaxID=1903694 RepID=A0A1Y0CZT0_9GAMM|nr:UDP-N-acetylmuramoyl-L-alanine--D-glutamate ligase [Oceanisphaera avium]ART80843.1 UDP-N-acetylmuramoyl-L-alanine--D-glutamate ligase [Oceanisphaera avium]